MKAFRLDKSTQGDKRLDDAESWAWRESRTKSGQLIWRESGGMGWCVGPDGDQAAPLFLGPFLCNRRGDFLCTEIRDRARERRHAWNFMSPGSFGIVL